MGLLFSKLWKRLSNGKERRLLMVGLDGAGKTTILYKLKLGQVIHTIPTIGFNVESVRFSGSELNIWDIGGQEKIRPLWKYYYQNTDAVIFVVDSTDTGRLDDSKDCHYNAKFELDKMMEDDELRNAVLLVFANKQDAQGALPVYDISRRLGLQNYRNRSWYIQGTNALQGDGLFEGLEWLINALNKKKDYE
jgi:small GTP-binding protein